MSHELLVEFVARAPMVSWEGPAWRFHKQKYQATDPTGSRYYSGRYHRASDLYRDEECWMALYLSLSPEVCIGEILRHISPSLLPELNDYRLTEIHLQLQRVIDVRDVQLAGFSAQDLATATSYDAPQTVARLAIERGAGGVLVPSATQLGDNLVVFPEFLDFESELTIVGSRDPVLYVPRTD